MIDLQEINGIGPKYQEKLVYVGIDSTKELFEKASTNKGRVKIEKDTGISQKKLFEIIKELELFKIKGIGEKYFELLFEVGIKTLESLSGFPLKNLIELILKVVNEKKFLNKKPSVTELKSWINQAKEQPRLIIDIGLVTPLEEEFDTFNKIFGEPIDKFEFNKKEFYHFYNYSLPNSKLNYSIVATIAGKGNSETQASTQQLLNRFICKKMVLIGIAGSLVKKDLKVGDIIIASGVEDWLGDSSITSTEDQKSNINFGGKTIDCEGTTTQISKNYKSFYKDNYLELKSLSIKALDILFNKEDKKDLFNEESINKVVNIISGLIASGPFVHKAKEFNEWFLRNINRNFKAIDQDSYGFLKATRLFGYSGNNWVIRGISDYANEEKNKIDEKYKSKLRTFAVTNVSYFFKSLLDLELI